MKTQCVPTRQIALLAAASVALLTGAATAATQTWDGGTANWNTNNWNTGNAWTNGNDAVVSSGMVQVTSAPAASSVTLNGGQFSINANNLTISSAFSLNGTVSGGAIYMADLAAGQTTELTGTITLNATSNIGGWWNDKTMKLSGKITGSGGLILESSSGICAKYLITGSTNDYAGGTTVNGYNSSYPSILDLGANNALPSDSALALNNSNLYLNGYSQTLSKIDGSGSHSVQGSGALTLGAGDTTSTYAGTMSGAASLTKTGSGTLTISGFDAIASSGPIQVNGGTLEFSNRQFGGHTSTSAPVITIGTGAVLTSSAGSNTPLNNITLNGGTLTSSNGGGTTWGAWNINGGITSTGNSTITDTTGYGVLLNSVGTNTNVDVQSGSLAVSAIVRDGRDGSAPYDAHTTSLTKQGSGTLILSGANTYSGGTTISQGTLLVNNASDSGTGTGAVTVSSGARLGGSGTISGATSVGGTLNAGDDASGRETLAFNSSLTLSGSTVFDIGGTGRGTGYDGIDITGALTNGGALSLNFTNAFSAGSYTFDLFDIMGGQSGDFTSVSLVGSYLGSLVNSGGVWSLNSGGNSWTFTQSTGDLSFTAVPELSNILIGGLLGVGLLRRKRKK